MTTNQQAATTSDYNSDILNGIFMGLRFPPELSVMLSTLVEILWPSSQEDVWSEIENSVEQLVNQTISADVYQQVENCLQQIYLVLQDYLATVADPSNDDESITQKFTTADNMFNETLPYFQAQDSEFLLLPLFAQFANLHLSLLRDALFFSKDWGWSEEQQENVQAEICQKIQDYTTYTEAIYNGALNVVTYNAPYNYHHTEPFNTVNAFVREMTLTVLDFKSLWLYFDSAENDDLYLDREIYSDALGTADNSGLIQLPSPPTKPITSIEVWAWDRIDACQVTYDTGGGPGGETQTPRMGDQNGGTSTVFDLTQLGPIVSVATLSGSIINAMTFTFFDGSTSSQQGGKYPGGTLSTYSYPYEILSSIKIMGISDYYGSADCVVYGFKYYQDAFLPSESLLRAMYVSSPKKISLEQLTQNIKYNKPEQLAAQIKQWADMNQWDTLRQNYWSNLRAQLSSNKS